MRWRDIRAGLIAFAIFLGVVEGCPIPPPHETLPWQQGYVGLVRPIQTAIMTPFRWIPRTLHVSQRWALFQAAEPERFRLEIRTRTADNVDRLIFRAGDPAHAAYATTITQRRVRGIWNPNERPPGQYALFTRWLAGRIFAADPKAVVVWFRFERVQIEDGVPRGLGTYAFDSYQYRGTR